jgi:stage II sporulation protein D
LKSTFFSVALLEKNVILTGKGFGHGVGLCQEGAMNMAKKGYKANEILDFYFPNAELHTNWLTHE